MLFRSVCGASDGSFGKPFPLRRCRSKRTVEYSPDGRLKLIPAALQTAHAAQLNIAQGIVPELMQPDSEPLQMASHQVDHTAYQGWKPLPVLADRHQPVFVVGFPRSGTTLL